MLSRILITGALALLITPAFAAEPAFTLAEDGSAFVYKARPGDQPGTVAAMFGIGQREMPAFLAANDISDPTRVGIGHVYRIPNPLATRATEAEAYTRKIAELVADLGSTALEVSHPLLVAHDLDTTRTAATDAEQRAAGLERHERLWPLVMIVGMLLILVSGGLGWVAFAALQKTGVAEARARALAAEVEEKRRSGLAERQHSGKRIIDLEAKIHDLETQLARPLPTRRSPASTG